MAAYIATNISTLRKQSAYVWLTTIEEVITTIKRDSVVG
jgi:hypothetical protein